MIPTSAHRIAVRYLRAYDPSVAKVPLVLFPQDVESMDRHLPPGTSGATPYIDWKQVGRIWLSLVTNGRIVGDWVLNTRSIPNGKAKALEMALRPLAKTRTNDMAKWWMANERHMRLLVEAIGWPERKEDSEGIAEIFSVPPFKVHNTIHLKGEKLEVARNLVENAVLALKGNPKLARVMYGDVYLVGKIRESNTLAWYRVSSDDLYMRPETKLGPGEVASLLHELGHRYWYKFMDSNQQRDWERLYYRVRGSGKATMPQPGDVLDLSFKGVDPPVVVRTVTPSYLELENNGLKYRTDKIMEELGKKADYPSRYAAKNQDEYFAECFAFFAMGILKDPHRSAFKDILGLG